MCIIRVFPRRTEATPIDDLAYINEPPPMLLPEADEVHISVAFTYDMPRAEWLYKQWEVVGLPVKMGGPAFGKPSGEHIPGLYTKKGFTFTSRGCPNKCWFCSVWRREGLLRTLPIKDGWIVHDDNILACPEAHIRSVFEMLARQQHRPIFKGGIEAKLLKPWHVELLHQANTERLYCAYDTPDDYEPLLEAGKLLTEAGITVANRKACAYVLIGYPKDTIEKAEKRLTDTIKAGFFPFAMLWKDKHGHEDKNWRRFQREWCRPAIVGSKIRHMLKEA
jgi:hypothetical protein